MSNAGEFETNRYGIEPSHPTARSPSVVEGSRNAKCRDWVTLFQQLFDFLPSVPRDQIVRQQLGDQLPSFRLVPFRSSSPVGSFTHGIDTHCHTRYLSNKSNFTVLKRHARSSRNCERSWRQVNTAPEGDSRDTIVPLTAGKSSLNDQHGSHRKVSSTTRGPCLITDGGTSVHTQILDDNGVGQNEGFQGDYTGTEAAREALETFVMERVDDIVITRSRSVCNAVDVDTRIQEVGKTLGAHLDGNTPEGFLDDVRVSKWRDTDPIKWRFERIAGEADTRRSRHLQKPALVREISDATGATGARFETAEEDGSSWEKAHVTREWMRDVLEAVCEIVDYEPGAVREDDEQELRDWIDELTQAGTTEVLERAIGIEDPGADSSWNRSTLRKIHDVVVAGRDPSEVGR